MLQKDKLFVVDIDCRMFKSAVEFSSFVRISDVFAVVMCLLWKIMQERCKFCND